MTLIDCPKCKGKGKVKEDNKMNFGVFGMIATLGVLNAIDNVFSERWIEDCRKCSGLGKLIMKTNENGK
jgi:DnaJ-class molecular chaperone